jgi:hypothetical protein
MSLYLTGVGFKKKTHSEKKIKYTKSDNFNKNLNPKKSSLEKLINKNEYTFKKIDFSNGNNTRYTNFYLKNQDKKRSKSKSLIEFFPNEKKFEKKKQEEKFINKSEKEFVDFLIQDQTKFADLNNIENYFKRQIYDNTKIFDSKLIQILKKNNELEILEKQIEKELIENADIDYNYIKEEYNLIKNQIRDDIKIRQYDYQSLITVKNDLINQQVKINFYCFNIIFDRLN